MARGLLYALLAVTMIFCNFSFLGVQPAHAEDVKVKSIHFDADSKNLTLVERGATITLKYTIGPSNATNTNVKWYSSKSSVAEVENGVVIPKSPGITTIVVVAEDGGAMDSSKITVTAKPVSVSGVSLDKQATALMLGGSKKLVATVSPGNATNKAVNWNSTNPEVANVDAQGIVTAVGVGRATVVVTTEEGNKADTCDVTVTGIEPTGVTVNKSSLQLYKGGSSVGLSATVSPANASIRKVAWSSSDASVAKVDSYGKVTPVAVGSAVITAATINGKTATCLVSVQEGGGKVKHFDIQKLSDRKVKITWSGTDGSVFVEIKKNSNDSLVDSKYTNTKSVTFTGLKSSSEYDVYINGEYMDSFELDESEADDVEVDKVSNSSVEISWSGTRGEVEVELRKKKDDKYVDSKTTSSRKVKFSGLSGGTEYRVYIDGEYMTTFELGKIRNLTMDNKTSTSVDLSWTGTSGTVKVEIRKYNRSQVVDWKKTDSKHVTFTNLQPDTQYDVYIDGTFVDSFTTSKQVLPKEISVSKSARNQYIEISWSGSKGAAEVTLQKNGSHYATRQTSTNWVRFEGVEANQEYAVYINKTFVQMIRLPFKDMENHWAQGAVDRLVQNHIINGFYDGTFKPDQLVTREQFIKMLILAKRCQLISSPSVFRDVQQTRWSQSYIATAIAYGIINPKEIGPWFAPEKPIPREEMAVYLARALSLTPDARYVKFTDNNTIQVKYRGYVGAVVKTNIITGFPDMTFRPAVSLQRAEAAQVINKIFLP